MTSSDFLAELEWRGLLYQTAGTGVEEHLRSGSRTGYCGFDPTGDSLTVGNFNSINLLRHFQRAGHTPIVLLGGGTGLIGDPSGKDAERQLQTRETIQENVRKISTIFERVLSFEGPNAAIIVDNLDWLGELSYIDVLRDVGKHFSVNVMMQKESVRERLHNRDHGISYTEFSYMILQAYDYLHLYRSRGCTLQVAGSDQYGNIVAGMDLIRRELDGAEGGGYGITSPLITRSDGKKFGKTEDGAVWLTAERTSPYAFYQFWINTEDAKAIDYLRRFTLLEKAEIDALEAQHQAAPHERATQTKLAQEMTDLLHGTDARHEVESATKALFGGGDLKAIGPDLLRDVFSDVPSSTHAKSSLAGEGALLSELLPETSLAPSRRQAREFLSNGAVSVNGEKVDLERKLTTSDLLHGETILLRRGKKHWHATRWAD